MVTWTSPQRVDTTDPEYVVPPDDVEVLRRVAPKVGASEVYVCGPDAWTDAVRSAARSAGVAEPRLHTEQFAW